MESKKVKQGPQSVTLTNGFNLEYPMLGLGTWKSKLGETGNAAKVAIKAGYRFLDCANDYNNEAEIGEALVSLYEEGVVKREDLWLQAKLWNTNHRPEHVKADLEATLKDLQTTYLDSFVIHWPQACPATGEKAAVRTDGAYPANRKEGTMFPIEDNGLLSSDNASHFVETWHAMEELVDQGLVKTIGLSNFNIRQIQEVLDCAKKYKPAMLQSECHPYLQQKDTIDFCKRNGIAFQGYSPLGSNDRPWAKPEDPKLLEDPKVTEMAKRHGKSPAQCVIRWHLQRGVCVVPKSVTPSRIQENFDVWNFELTAADMDAFDSLNRGWRHLLWPETAMHPDYPFKDDLPHDHVIPKAPLASSSGAAKE